MENDERLEHHLTRCQPIGRFDGSRDEERTDDRIWLSKAGSEGFADVMDSTVLRPSGCNDGVDVLSKES
jgi:hypothetical protein